MDSAEERVPEPNIIADYTSLRVEYGHFHGIENVNSLSAIQRKVDELHQYAGRPLLLPDGYDRLCHVDYNAERAFLRVFFVTPFVGQLAHHPEYRQPMCDFIQKNFSLAQAPSESNYHYGLWIPRSATIRLSTYENERSRQHLICLQFLYQS